MVNVGVDLLSVFSNPKPAGFHESHRTPRVEEAQLLHTLEALFLLAPGIS